MQKEFTCGTYKAAYGAGGTTRWHIIAKDRSIAVVEPDGSFINFTELAQPLCDSDLLQILILMNNIKRQYKQLQTT